MFSCEYLSFPTITDFKRPVLHL